jgi:N-acetylneuraminic acid mutarotase
MVVWAEARASHRMRCNRQCHFSVEARLFTKAFEMRRLTFAFAIAICVGVDALTGFASAAAAASPPRLAPLPEKAGLAGAFAGVSHGALLVAGGANFPQKKPWQGGAKVWHDRVYVLEKPEGNWAAAGKLPRTLAYGVCATHGNGMVCVGGSDAQRHYADAFRVTWKEGKLVVAPLPSLPMAVASAAGALVGDRLYIAGGSATPDARAALKKAWMIDLAAAKPTWNEIDPPPGEGRMLAIAAGYDGAFWLAGGVELVADDHGKAVRRYLRDAYRYTSDAGGKLGKGWQRIADLPHPVAAAPSPAPADARGFYILGGDDGSQVDASPAEHRGFDAKVLRYSAASAKWETVGNVAAPRVTTPCVSWDKTWIVPSGEVRPGVRSPEVWRIALPGGEPAK